MHKRNIEDFVMLRQGNVIFVDMLVYDRYDPPSNTKRKIKKLKPAVKK